MDAMSRVKSATRHRERYQVLKTMLEDRRAEIHGKLRSLRETLPTENETVRDAEEQSVDDFVRDVDFALMEMKSATLRQIDEAIHRLEHGSYGLCAECQVEIPEPRLRALPFAELCRDCQVRQEELHTSDREPRAGLDDGNGRTL